MLERYVNKVRLLLSILQDIAKEKVFALKGGTAINLFYRDMPRLSVDIDLTYLPIDEREKSLQDIDAALDRMASDHCQRRVKSLKPAPVLRFERSRGSRIKFSRIAVFRSWSDNARDNIVSAAWESAK